MRSKDILLCLAFAITLPIGQVLFKLAADQSHTIQGGLLARVVFNPPLIAAFAWYGVTALFWVYVLTRIPLSAAYPFSILGSALVPILAWMLFGEQVTMQATLGFAIMLLGFFLVVRAR
jgi:multidrug transporter EmrE-like cation transporter